jgi:hypothetical protein
MKNPRPIVQNDKSKTQSNEKAEWVKINGPIIKLAHGHSNESPYSTEEQLRKSLGNRKSVV